MLAYESAGYLATALRHNPRPEALKQTLQEVDRFAGLQGEIRFNRYGDPQRQTFLAIIRDGRFAVLD